MRAHTNEYKEQIKEFGRSFAYKITYNNEELTGEHLFSVTPVLNTQLLKSVMKQLDFKSDLELPIGTKFNLQIGLLVNEEYEYLDYGTYNIYQSEYSADEQLYNYTCYDNILNSMKEYSSLQNGTFPMTIKEYITNICNDLGLIFITDDFANQDKTIGSDLYANLGYTYRDVLDELSQVVAGNILNTQNDYIEIKYPTETNDEITDGYLNEINVDFGEKFGKINSIVLSRSAESDNVYLQDEESIEVNGLCEFKIVDNQIMNFNDRSDYLPDILEKLNGLEFYVNDFTSKGITYYEALDLYNVKLGKTSYKCLMLNNEQNFTSGLSEKIYTEMPKESVTDYTKADKTDRRINQTYRIADKQNQIIEDLISTQNEQREEISKTTQTINNIQNLFQITGGSNLIKNSVGLFGNQSWIQSEIGTFEYGEDNELIGITNSMSKITISNGILITDSTNITGLTINEIKSLSYKVKQDANTTTKITLYGLDEENPIYVREFNEEIDNWEEIFEDDNQFYINTPNLTLKIESTSTYDGKFYISDLMLNNGDKNSWELANGEVNGSVIKLSQLGIQVYAVEGNTLTMMTTQGLQVRSLLGTSIGDIITEFTNLGIITIDITQSGKHIQKNLVHDVISVSGTEHYIDYIMEV